MRLKDNLLKSVEFPEEVFLSVEVVVVRVGNDSILGGSYGFLLSQLVVKGSLSTVNKKFLMVKFLVVVTLVNKVGQGVVTGEPVEDSKETKTVTEELLYQ